MNEVRPPIPASLMRRPVKGGLACPYVNVQMEDGGVDFRAVHQSRFADCWTHCRCQSCGDRIYHGVVALVGAAAHVASGHFTEPPLCPPCLQYSSKACPMLGGRLGEFADRDRVSEGHRGETCPDPGCDCGGWQETDPEGSQDHRDDPAHPYYAAFTRPGGYAVTVREIVTRCVDRGCEHERTIVTGGQLEAPPLKVVLVSEPGKGRVWHTLSADEVAELTQPEEASAH